MYSLEITKKFKEKLFNGELNFIEDSTEISKYIECYIQIDFTSEGIIIKFTTLDNIPIKTTKPLKVLTGDSITIDNVKILNEIKLL